MIESLFTSKSRVKILELFLFYPEKNFYLREIARLTKENVNSVVRELKIFQKLNIIHRMEKGKLILYESNKKSPMFEPLKMLFMRTESFGKLLEKAIKNDKIKYALIFGSFASGKETEKSDIDMLIIGNIKQSNIVEAISNFELKMSREINYIIWNEKEFEKRVNEHHHLLTNINKKPIIMIIGDEHEFRKVVE